MMTSKPSIYKTTCIAARASRLKRYQQQQPVKRQFQIYHMYTRHAAETSSTSAHPPHLREASSLPTSRYNPVWGRLELGLAPGLCEDGLHLGGLHDVALGLELAAHEEALGVGRAGDELAKVLLSEGESNCCCAQARLA